MPEPIVIPADKWYSAQHTKTRSTEKLTTGLIVIAHRRPFRIAGVTQMPFDEWPEKFTAQWEKEGEPPRDDWHRRPFKVEGLWEEPGASNRIHSTAASASHLWDVLPEHFAVCRLCHELPPCSHIHTERITELASERLERQMAIVPGACHGCLEPISKRQKAFTFPGPNLIRPDFGDDSAVFHLRRACSGPLASYDKRWAAAEQHRRKFFYCDGMQVFHYDGSIECDQEGCTAKGDLKNLVDHRVSVWHRPGTRADYYDVMREFGQNPGTGHEVCWCLSKGPAGDNT